MVQQRNDMRDVRGVGIGFRPQLATALLGAPERVDFVEVVAEACRDTRARREAAAVAELWPVVPHGVKLSLGSAEGIEAERAKELGELARELRAPMVSEHVSFVRAGGREIGHLTELPMTREAIRVVTRNVAVLRRHLPDVPLLLENVARAFLWEDAGGMTEGAFHHEIVRATGCELLLDVANLYANARNAGRDPVEVLSEFPLEHVRMVHVAGGIVEEGFYFDTHAHPVPAPIFDLVARVLAVRPDAAIMLERDGSFDDLGAILAEVETLRRVRGHAQRSSRPPSPPPQAAPLDAPSEATATLAAAQATLAERLIDATEPADATVALRRARVVLERKRADDALPLLPTLASRICTGEALALGRIAETPRLPAMNAIADAMRIAESALARPHLAAAAARDGLVLRARFAGGPARPRPRAAPWMGKESLPNGASIWAWKGFGRSSAVRFLERAARSPTGEKGNRG